jgi:hypothetical protein
MMPCAPRLRDGVGVEARLAEGHGRDQVRIDAVLRRRVADDLRQVMRHRDRKRISRERLGETGRDDDERGKREREVPDCFHRQVNENNQEI